MSWKRSVGCSMWLAAACASDAPEDTRTTMLTLSATDAVSDESSSSSASTDPTDPSATVTGGTPPPTTATTGGATAPVPTTDGPLMFDVGTIPDAPPIEKSGCAGIDFLFAIDNSGSMGAQQTQLLASFDGFITGIQNSLDNVDSFHVGVVTSDPYTSNAPGCQQLGDLVTQTMAGGVCTPFADGNRFLTDADNIQTAFPCIGEVGIFGSGVEQPVSAVVNALSPENAAPGACNEGFVRDDSILVIIIVTDDPPRGTLDDANPAWDTTPWVPAVLAAKNDDPEAVVVIGFIPWQDVSCVPLTMESPNLINFVDAFGDQGIKASICEPDYGPIFQSTVETIQTTCDNFVPQG